MCPTRSSDISRASAIAIYLILRVLCTSFMPPIELSNFYTCFEKFTFNYKTYAFNSIPSSLIESIQAFPLLVTVCKLACAYIPIDPYINNKKILPQIR